MKKIIAMVALAAICMGTLSASATAFVPVKMQQDTVKKKIKKKHNKMKIKKKWKDTTKKDSAAAPR